MVPPLETAIALSELYTFQCCQWEPIRNSQLIRKYKEIPVHRENIETKDRWTPPTKAHCHDNNSYNFSDFQLYHVTLPIDPPSLWSKSWKWYTALHSIQLYIYIYCHFMNCDIWSWASEQVSHAFVSMPNFYDFIMLLLLLCISPQHIYVVVVVVLVVVYYTSGTITIK